MNNTEKAECVRAILSKELTPYEKFSMELCQTQDAGYIAKTLENLEINEKNKKTVEAIKFLISVLDN